MRELLVLNRQRVRRLHAPFLKRLLESVLHEALEIHDYELGFQLVGPRRMTRINEDFLNHQGSTDVITFDHRLPGRTSPLHGEAFICVADAVLQAREFQTDWREEIVRYAIHGILHLQGWDDLDPRSRRKMKSRENLLVEWVRKHFDCTKLGSNNAGVSVQFQDVSGRKASRRVR